MFLTQPESEGSLTEVSNRGTRVSLALDFRRSHASPTFTGEAFVLARRGDREFYRLPKTDGLPCWGTGKLRNGSRRIGVSCQFKPQFPSRAFPLQDFSPMEMSVERPHPHYIWLSGVAADGVHRIAVIDEDNRLVPAVDVVDNVYFAEKLPKGDYLGIAALDSDGGVIWRSTPVP